jgi:hypothetical protein
MANKTNVNLLNRDKTIDFFYKLSDKWFFKINRIHFYKLYEIAISKGEIVNV